LREPCALRHLSAGASWSVTLSFNDGGVITTSTHDYTVRATVSLAEVAAGLAAKINAAGTGYSASVNGNTLVIENANEPGFATGTRVTGGRSDRQRHALGGLVDRH
jgi:hypothetical protein